MASSPSDYSLFATRHLTLLDQYAALIAFKQAVYGGLSMQAMATVMRHRMLAAGVQKLPRMSVIVAKACELASGAGIGEAETTKAVRRYRQSVAASGSRMKKGKIGRPRRGKSPSEKIIDAAIARRRAAIERDLSEIPPSIEKARAAIAHEIE